MANEPLRGAESLREFPLIQTGPATVHELITRNKVDDLAVDMEKAHTAIRLEIAELRRLIYGLIFTVVGAIVVQIVMRLAEWH